MCVKKDTCPINFMVIDEKEEAPSEYKDKYTFTNVKLNKKFIHYTNEAIDNYIIVKFLYRERLDKNLSPFIQNSNEKLNKYSIESCKITELQIGTQPIYHHLYTSEPSETYYDFYYRPFIGVKSNCVLDDFYDSEKTVNDYNHFRTMKLIWFISCCSYCLVLIIIVMIIQCVKSLASVSEKNLNSLLFIS